MRERERERERESERKKKKTRDRETDGEERREAQPEDAACTRPSQKKDTQNLAEEDYSRSLKVGNRIASILKSNVQGTPALFGLYPVSNFMGFTVTLRTHLWFRSSFARGVPRISVVL